MPPAIGASSRNLSCTSAARSFCPRIPGPRCPTLCSAPSERCTERLCRATCTNLPCRACNHRAPSHTGPLFPIPTSRAIVAPAWQQLVSDPSGYLSAFPGLVRHRLARAHHHSRFGRRSFRTKFSVVPSEHFLIRRDGPCFLGRLLEDLLLCSRFF